MDKILVTLFSDSMTISEKQQQHNNNRGDNNNINNNNDNSDNNNTFDSRYLDSPYF